MVIYTAIFDYYDELKPPTVITEGWKYVCYTNNPLLKSDVWEVRYVKNKVLSGAKAARIIKIRFFDYIKDELSIWCDASMQINVDLNKFVKQYHKKDFTLLYHPSRDCTYMEAAACIKLNKDDATTINKQINQYHKEGLPKFNGMVQTGLMIRTNTYEVREHCKKWAIEVLKHSKRDQLSFNYCLWKYNLITPNMITSDVLKNEFKLYKHGY
jgi:hypothetical protein